MDTKIVSYLAGVIDSDGHIAIKRRRNGAGGWTYHPCIQVKQVETAAVVLCKETFGGNLRLSRPAAINRRPMHIWQITHQLAVNAAKQLKPFLRIKREQANLILDFGNKMADYRLRRRSFWFRFSADDVLVSPIEAALKKGVDADSIYQAVRQGSIPARRRGRRILIPERFLDSYVMVKGQHPLPLEYIQMRERIWQECKHLNRVGPR